jgi:hypothetical protein
MRKWRAENREKNRQNDLRCRVYRLARQKYGENDSSEKQGYVREEIARRLGRRIMMERRESSSSSVSSTCSWNSPPPRMMSPPTTVHFNAPPSTPLLIAAAAEATNLLSPLSDLVELPFYSAPQQKIELPSLNHFTANTTTAAATATATNTRTNSWYSSNSNSASASPLNNYSSSPILPHLSPTLCHSQRRTSSSSSSNSSISSVTSDKRLYQQEQKIIKKERRRSSSSVVMTAAAAALRSTKNASLSVNTTPIPTSSSLILLTPTTPDELKDTQEKAEGKRYSEDDFCCVLPSMHAFLSFATTAQQAAVAPALSAANDNNQQKQNFNHFTNCIPTQTTATITTKGGIKYVDSNKILDEFVGVVLNYVDNNAAAATVAQ